MPAFSFGNGKNLIEGRIIVFLKKLKTGFLEPLKINVF